MKKAGRKNITPAQLDTLLVSLQQRAAQAQPTYNAIEHKDKTRSTIALFFVKGYLFLLGGIFTLILAYNFALILSGHEARVLEVRDIMLVITGSVGSPLGFVVGYYFKGQEEKDRPY